ncbi:Transcriptional activator protein UGA3 [Neolecta irregularis DAH-3]|uniref:Transcriptional activator protein UGA3 n=1 Tax=Neolecta irregularis (strain DAH-3) TaxID=1198029 RepID=A0A1U7LVX7_NEOID|nr:Transcriptional activator protein UGA3 [Neolecta irregularis DAH-3]|eukprot:OLL26836.1 Transcriptional activator protein UGA3 [Neolecta irregularis DAH-3]
MPTHQDDYDHENTVFKISQLRKSCTICRAQKLKCDETKPVCDHCTKAGTECIYQHFDLRWNENATLDNSGRLSVWTDRISNFTHEECELSPSSSDTESSMSRKNVEHTDKPYVTKIHAFFRQSVESLQIRRPEPLPDLLLESSINREIFQYYLSYHTRLLVARDDSSNPFRTIIAPLAYNSTLLLGTILAVSAIHRQKSGNAHPKWIHIYSLLDDIFRDLGATLETVEGQREPGTLATLLMLSHMSTSMYPSSPPFTPHFEAAKMIIEHQGGPKKLLLEHPFLVEWFALFDIMQTMMGESSGLAWNGLYWLTPQTLPRINRLFGFSGSLATHFQQINILQTRLLAIRQLSEPGFKFSNSDLDIKTLLDKITTGRVVEDFGDHDFVISSEVFRVVVLLKYYRVLLEQPADSWKIESLVGRLEGLIGRIFDSKDILPAYAIRMMWPLLVVSAETLDSSQVQLLAKVKTLRSLGIGNLGDENAPIGDIWRLGLDQSQVFSFV